MTDNIFKSEEISTSENNMTVTTIIKNRTAIKIGIKYLKETEISKYRNAKIVKKKRLIKKQENCQVSKNHIARVDTIKEPTRIINAHLGLKPSR